MKININTNLYVPLEIGDFTFQLDFSDKGLEKMLGNFKYISTEMKVPEKVTMQVAADALKETLDLLLEDGAYDKIYAKYPSTMVMSDIVQQVTLNILEELKNRVPESKEKELLAAYLKKNNK